MTNCPLCSSAAPQGAAECPSCGVIFAKLRARAERARSDAVLPLEAAPAPPLDPRQVRIAAFSLVACWMIGLGLYYHIALSRQPRHGKPLALEGRSSVTVRDAYGLTSEVPVHSARSGPARPEPPPPSPAEPENSKPDPFDE